MNQFEQSQQNIGKKPDILQNTGLEIKKKEGTPTISIISPSLNLGQFLEDTIVSIANQSFQKFEHIVIDGGSTDGTLDILRRYPHIIWISEKDSGYEEAMRKGLTLAKGKYIMNCAISDGYLDRDWFKRCIEVLDVNPEISLVWGFPQYLSEDNILGNISYREFHHTPPPQKYAWVSYWLKTCFWLPEANFCVRKEVFDRCFPQSEDFSEYKDPWYEFNFNFNHLGYLPFNLPVVANFGRTHTNQRGQIERESGLMQRRSDAYFGKVKQYRWQLLNGTSTHYFRDGSNNILPVKFSNRKFRWEYLEYLPWGCYTFIRKDLSRFFLAKFRHIYRRST